VVITINFDNAQLFIERKHKRERKLSRYAHPHARTNQPDRERDGGETDADTHGRRCGRVTATPSSGVLGVARGGGVNFVIDDLIGGAGGGGGSGFAMGMGPKKSSSAGRGLALAHLVSIPV
jgi:hypothetical protein